MYCLWNKRTKKKETKMKCEIGITAIAIFCIISKMNIGLHCCVKISKAMFTFIKAFFYHNVYIYKAFNYEVEFGYVENDEKNFLYKNKKR